MKRAFSKGELIAASIGGAAVGALTVALWPKRTVLPSGAALVAPTAASRITSGMDVLGWIAQPHPVNPYAMAEIISRAPIDWKNVSNPRAVAARILGISQQALSIPTSATLAPWTHPPFVAAMRRNTQLAARVPQNVTSTPQGFAPKTNIAPPANVARPLLSNATKLSTAQTKLNAMGLSCGDWQRMFSADRRANVDYLLSRITRIRQADGSDINAVVEEIDPWCYQDVPGWNPDGVTWAPIAPLYGSSGISVLDPVQGNLANCYLISMLASIAWVYPQVISTHSFQKREVPSPSDRQAIFEFYDERTGNPADITVSYDVELQSGSYVPLFCRSSRAGQSWPAVYEKAVGVLVTGAARPDYTTPGFVFARGETPTVTNIAGVRSPIPAFLTLAHPSVEDVWSFVTSYCPGGRASKAMAAGTNTASGTGSGVAAWNDAMRRFGDISIVAGHAYSVLGTIVASGGRRYVVLRNPWGRHEATGSEVLPTQSWQGLTLNDGGVFALSIEAFAAFYLSIWGG